MSCPYVANLRLAKRYCTGLKNARVVTFCQSCSLSLSPVLWQQDHMTVEKVVTGQETVIVMRLNWCCSATHGIWLCLLSCYNFSWSRSANFFYVLVFCLVTPFCPVMRSCSTSSVPCPMSFAQWQTSVLSRGPVLPIFFPYPVSCPVTAFCPVTWSCTTTVPYPSLLSCYNLCLAVVHFCESCLLSQCTVLWQPWQPSVQSCGPVLPILFPIPVSCPPCLMSYDNLLYRLVVLFYQFRFLSLSCDNNSSNHVVLFCQSCSLFLSPVLWYLLPRMVFICPAIPYSCLMSCDNLFSSHVVLSTNSVFCLSFCDNC